MLGRMANVIKTGIKISLGLPILEAAVENGKGVSEGK